MDSRQPRFGIAKDTAGVLLLLSLMLPSSAWAQPASDSPAARDVSTSEYDTLTERGLSAFSAGRADEARELFERAHALTPSARTLRALGITALALDRYAQAWTELRGALEHPTRALTDEQRTEVHDLLEWMRTSLGMVRVDTQPVHAAAKVDGRALETPETLLEPGDHRLEVVADGFEPHTGRFHLDVGERLALRVMLSAKRVADSRSKTEATLLQEEVAREPRAFSEPNPLADASSAARADSAGWRWWFFGGGLALVAAGGTLLALGLDDIATVESREKVRWSEIESAHARAPWLIGSGVTLGVVGLGGLTAAIVSLWTEGEPERRSFAWSVGPGELTIRQQF